jgi:hypothetical protein
MKPEPQVFFLRLGYTNKVGLVFTYFLEDLLMR